MVSSPLSRWPLPARPAALSEAVGHLAEAARRVGREQRRRQPADSIVHGATMAQQRRAVPWRGSGGRGGLCGSAAWKRRACRRGGRWVAVMTDTPLPAGTRAGAPGTDAPSGHSRPNATRMQSACHLGCMAAWLHGCMAQMHGGHGGGARQWVVLCVAHGMHADVICGSLWRHTPGFFNLAC